MFPTQGPGHRLSRGTALGPSLGSAPIAGFGWPAVFGVVSGLGRVAYVLGLRMFPAGASAAVGSRRPDIAGMLALSLGAYALAASFGGSLAVSVVLAGLAVPGLIAFVAIESRVQ